MTLRKIITKIGFLVDEAQAKKAEQRTKKMSLAMKATLTGVLLGLAAIGKAAITAAADMEMLATQFEVMLGSAEAAADMMDQLKTFASSTPFALADLAAGSQQLLAFGIAEDRVIESMRMLGDAAGGNAEKLQGLVLAYGKVQAKGKAQTEELNMLTERGVPILGTLATKYGVTKQAVLDMAAASKISAKDITDAFSTMTSEGGMFFQGMQKQSLTFSGLVSTMKDNITLMLASVGERLLPTLKLVVDAVTKLVQGPLGKLVESLLTTLTPVLDIILELLDPIIEALLPLTDTLVIIMPLIVTLLKLTKLLGPTLELVAVSFELINNVLTKVIPIIDHMTDIMVKGFSFIYNAMINLMIPATKMMSKAFTVLWNVLKNLGTIILFLIKLLGGKLKGVLIGFGELIMNNIFRPIGEGISNVLGWFTSIGNHVKNIVDYIGSLWDVLWEGILEKFPMLGTAISWIGNTFKGMWDFVANVFSTIWEGIISAIQNVIGWINKIPGIDFSIPALTGNKSGGDAATNDFIASNAPGANPAVTPAGERSTTITMTNDISVTVPEGTNAGAIKSTIEETARAIFTIELQKLIINEGT